MLGTRDAVVSEQDRVPDLTELTVSRAGGAR